MPPSAEAVLQHGAAIAQGLSHANTGVRSAVMDVMGASPEAVLLHGAAIAPRH